MKSREIVNSLGKRMVNASLLCILSIMTILSKLRIPRLRTGKLPERFLKVKLGVQDHNVESSFSG